MKKIPEEQIEIEMLEQELAIRKGSLVAKSHLQFCSKCHREPRQWPSDLCVGCSLEEEANARNNTTTD